MAGVRRARNLPAAGEFAQELAGGFAVLPGPLRVVSKAVGLEDGQGLIIAADGFAQVGGAVGAGQLRVGGDATAQKLFGCAFPSRRGYVLDVKKGVPGLNRI